MEETQLLQYFEGKTFLITGATGFLAKILLEKIFRLQPNIKKVFLLMRATAERTVKQRLQEEVLGIELFRVLRKIHGENFESIISSKIIPISGDVGLEDLGITEEKVREEMWREIDIIVNSAATTKFNERYDVSFGINVMGAMHIQLFATKCSKLQTLLHVSTAYVHGTKVGVAREKALHVDEIPILDIDSEKEVIEERLRFLQFHNLSHKEITASMKDLGTQRARLHGWANTYVFTKAMGEMMLGSFKLKCNIIIIRPTIITSTFKDPFPGWIEGLRTVDGVFAAYGKGKLKFFVANSDSLMDLIPGDMVVNCMIAAAATTDSSHNKHDLFVYQIGSSRQNPLKVKQVEWAMYAYLTKNPFLDARGKLIKVAPVTKLNSISSFHNYISFRYSPLLLVLRLANLICCNYFESVYTVTKQRVKLTMHLVELYKPYLFSEAIYDDCNTENLRMKVRGSKMDKEMEMLNFDPKCIVWDDYLINTHFPGVVKYALNKN